MRYLFIVLLAVGQNALGQIICSEGDKVSFKEKIVTFQKFKAPSYGDTITEIGKSFLGTPYLEKTLEVGEKESLVINLGAFDCTTFIENVLAFSQMLRTDEHNFQSFANQLKTIRYRNGVLKDYSSRLHYFTEWILNNNEKGLLIDITADLGGMEVQKTINFMGTHRDLYPFLANDGNYREILQVEATLAKKPLCIIPQNQIVAVEHNIKNGDIIALATSIQGLDVTHTGFAVRIKGRIHLLHASTSGEVTITQKPLVAYLKSIKKNTGIVVARSL